jgi:hypothetical protein
MFPSKPHHGTTKVDVAMRTYFTNLPVMKLVLLLVMALAVQPLFAQLDIEPLTGFQFKMNKQEALAQAKKRGGYVPESLQGERNLLLYGMKLLGFPNSMVLVQFHNNQLYNVAVSISAKSSEEQTTIFDQVLGTLTKTYGQPLSTKAGMLFWMITPSNPDSDRIILVRQNGFSINVQFANGELLKQAQPGQ